MNTLLMAAKMSHETFLSQYVFRDMLTHPVNMFFALPKEFMLIEYKYNIIK